MSANVGGAVLYATCFANSSHDHAMAAWNISASLGLPWADQLKTREYRVPPHNTWTWKLRMGVRLCILHPGAKSSLTTWGVDQLPAGSAHWPVGFTTVAGSCCGLSSQRSQTADSRSSPSNGISPNARFSSKSSMSMMGSSMSCSTTTVCHLWGPVLMYIRSFCEKDIFQNHIANVVSSRLGTTIWIYIYICVYINIYIYYI